ncbi:MAG: hypothetical protein PF517_10055 [Salinivirgaceae bacterium]|jgi:ABC-type Na+ efflux pump permease subunit|nr:hypothetical protein [Salinivirgaceae bacterium]
MKKNKLNLVIQGIINKILSKKYIALIILGFVSFGAMAAPKMISEQQIGMFKNSKTCVVVEDGNINYNLFMKEAVEKYWKSTEFEFIDHQEFEKRKLDSKYSFLVLIKEVWDDDPGGVSYDYVSLLLGGPTPDLNNMTELITIPISYSDDINADYGYAIPAIVKFIQKHVKNLEDRRIIISWRGLKYYNHSRKFKNKELLLNKSSLSENVNSAEEINAVYSYYIKLLTIDEIQAELSKESANVLFNFHVGPDMSSGSGKCFEMIFDFYGNLYYYSYRDITNENKDGFTRKDFKHLR